MTFDACSICCTVNIDVICHIGFKLYVRYESLSMLFVSLRCIVYLFNFVFFLFLSLADKIKLLIINRNYFVKLTTEIF